MNRFLYNDGNLKTRRKDLRKNLGLPEIILWQNIKAKKLGAKFRRQYSVGPFVLDFYCPEVRLGIELDGATHDNEQSYEYDRNREQFIKEQSIEMLRFQNSDILNNLESVIAEIKKYLV